MPFIQSVYCASVFTSSNGSACAENVAFDVQYARQTSHPFPVSQASKKASATSVIDLVFGIMMVSSLMSDTPDRHSVLRKVPQLPRIDYEKNGRLQSRLLICSHHSGSPLHFCPH